MSDNAIQQKRRFIRSLSIRQKIILAIIALSLFIFFTGGISVFRQQKNHTIDTAYKKLEVINNLKKKEIENYFSRLKNQTIILSDYELFVDAAKDLKQAFRLAESDGSINMSSSEIENHILDLKAYYNGKYLTLLNEKEMGEFSLEDVFPEEEKTALLQYLFIASNPNDFENKKLYDKPLNSGNYGLSHFKYHPKIRELALRYSIDDIYLIDAESGHVFYSLNKNPDFGTSLLSGPYRNSALAENFKETNKAELKNYVEINDLKFYAPSVFTPSMFISSPIFDNGKKIAVLSFKIRATKLDELITNGLSWAEIGLGQTGDISLVGNDNKLRNNSRASVQENDETYSKRLRKNNVETSIIEKINTFESTSLLLEKDFYEHSYKPGLDDKSTIKKYARNKEVSVAQKLNTQGINWNIVTSIDKSEIMKEQRKTTLILFFVSLIMIGVTFAAVYYYCGTIIDRINNIKNALKTLSRGEKFNEFKDKNNDEISETIIALNQLNERVDGAADFALSIGKGNFNLTFNPISEKDKLGVSLNEMKNSLENAKKEEEQRIIEERKRNWAAEGVAVFSDLLRRNNDNINKLSLTLVGKLVEYLDASLAGIFLLDNESTPPILELSASYAFDRNKFLKKEIELGEGLVGTCAQEQKTIYLKEIPEGYIQITSGFGETKPKTVLLVPMIVEEKIMGVLEIGSMKTFEDYQIEFVEKIGENIGSTLISVKINAQTSKLLEESRIKSEEMSAQEEEMRQNLEELQATQDEMKRIKQEEAKKEAERREKEEKILNQLKEQNRQMKEDQEKLEKQADELRAKETEMRQNLEELELEQSMFDSLLQLITDRVTIKDNDGKYLRLSKVKYEALQSQGIEQPIGKSDLDIFGKKHFERAQKTEQEVLDGKIVISEVEKIKSADGTYSWGATSRIRFEDKHGNIRGTIAVTKNITESKNNEIELQLFNSLTKNIAENLPSFLFGFGADGSIAYFTGKLSLVVNPEDKSSVFDIFDGIQEQLKKDESQFMLSHKVKEGDTEWNFDVLIFKNSGTNNGFVGFGIEKDLTKYDSTLKSAITKLIETKNNLDNLRKR